MICIASIHCSFTASNKDLFFSVILFQESMNMVTPAMQLASKIPDVHVQLWASALLKGNYLYAMFSGFFGLGM